MSILDFAEFKKAFEHAERYAIAAVEIKKLGDVRLEIKSAKVPAQRLTALRAYKTQAAKSLSVLKTWESNLSPEFEALVAKNKLFAKLDEEKKSVETQLADAEAEQRQAEAANKNVSGSILAQKQGLVNLEGDFTSIDSFIGRYKRSEAGLTSGSADSKEVLALANAVGPMIDKRKALKDAYTKTKADFQVWLFPDKVSLLKPQERTDLHAFLKQVVQQLQKIEGYAPLDAYQAALKAARGKMYDGKAGLVALGARSTEQGKELSKALDKFAQDVDAMSAELQGVPAKLPVVATVKRGELKAKLIEVQGLQTQIEKRVQQINSRIGDLTNEQTQFTTRIQKILTTASYQSLSPKDAELKKLGTDLSATAQTFTAKITQLKTKAGSFATAGAAAKQLVDARLMDYREANAQAELAKA